MTLFWHRRDLRIPDNVGLAAAAEAGPVIPVFSLDPEEREEVAPEYPAPTVDHAERREEAISTFAATREE